MVPRGRQARCGYNERQVLIDTNDVRPGHQSKQVVGDIRIWNNQMLREFHRRYCSGGQSEEDENENARENWQTLRFKEEARKLRADASRHSTARPAVEVPANKPAIETIDIGQFWIALPLKLMTVWWDVWERACKNVMAPSTAPQRGI